MTSLDVRAHRIIKELRHRIWQFRLDLEPQERSAVLLEALRRSSVADPDERYHTTRRNCMLRAFDVIDGAVRVSWPRRVFTFFTDITLFLPTRAPQHLRYRGLASRKKEEFRLKNMEEELGWVEHIDQTLYEEE
jgi:hypothetical protein